jgi:hypothetical protein
LELGNLFTGVTPASASPYLTLDFNNNGPDQVLLTVSSSLESFGEYFVKIAFNSDAPITGYFTVSTSGDFALGSDDILGPSPVETIGAVDIAGGGSQTSGFDVGINFKTNPSVFDDGESFVINLMGPGHTENSFNRSNGFFQAAAAIHGIGGTGEAIVTTGSAPVPAPESASSLPLLTVAVASLGLMRRSQTGFRPTAR